MHPRLRGNFVIALAGLLALCASARGSYTFTTLDDPLGVNGTYVNGVSAGNVVGYYFDSSNIVHGFIYNSSGFTTIDDNQATGTTPFGIGNGIVVGSYSTLSTNGFSYNGSSFTTIDDPAATNSTQAFGISNGIIAGTYIDSQQVYHGFKYNGLTYTTIDDPAGTDTLPRGIYGSTIVGSYFNRNVNADSHGFYLSGSKYTTLDDPSSTASTWATGMSGKTIVGYYSGNNTTQTHGFAYTGTTFTNVDDPLAGALGTYPQAIDGNTIVGQYFDANGNIHGFIANVPEPASLTALSLLVIGFLRYRPRRCSQASAITIA